MPDELNETVEGPEADGQSADADPEVEGQPEGDSLFDDTEPDEEGSDGEGAEGGDGEGETEPEGDDGDEGVEIVDVDIDAVLEKEFGGKFKTFDDMVKSHKELERKLTETATKNAEQEKQLSRAMEKVSGDNQAELTDDERIAMIDKFGNNPQKWSKDVAREEAKQVYAELEQRTAACEKTKTTASENALKSISEDPRFANLDDDVLAEFDKVVEEPEFKSQFDAITRDNYDKYSVEQIQEHFTKVYKLAAQVAKGRLYDQKNGETKANANKKAKQRYIQKKKLTTTRPTDKSKPAGGKGDTSNDDAEIQRIMNATG